MRDPCEIQGIGRVKCEKTFLESLSQMHQSWASGLSCSNHLVCSEISTVPVLFLHVYVLEMIVYLYSVVLVGAVIFHHVSGFHFERQTILAKPLQRSFLQMKEKKSTDQAARQLMGIKGAGESKNIWAIRLQLCKPVTWIPVIWGVACGAAASGNYHTLNPFDLNSPPLSLVMEDALKALGCMMLSGPLLTGYTQTLNDWEDREIDAINEPYRPIPSGAISAPQVITQIIVLLLSGLGLAYGLDKWAGHEDLIISKLALFGSFIAYIYSAPPLKLKANGWLGTFALGSSYISLPWLCGQAMFGELSWQVTLLTIFYSLAGLGIAIVNDFKSIEGDRKLGLNSLPVAFGVDVAKWITVGTIDLTQLAIAAYLFYLQETTYGVALLALIAPQIYFQFKYFLPDPIANDVKYQASAQPFLVLGILTTALAIGHHGPL